MMDNGGMMEVTELWAGDGHVTDVVLDWMAEGRDEVLPEQVVEHVMSCEVCARRMGEALQVLEMADQALRSLDSRDLVELRAERPGDSLPVGVVVAALVVAVVGTAPWIRETLDALARGIVWGLKWGPKIVYAVAELFADQGAVVGVWWTVALFGAALVMAGVGLMAVRGDRLVRSSVRGHLS